MSLKNSTPAVRRGEEAEKAEDISLEDTYSEEAGNFSEEDSQQVEENPAEGSLAHFLARDRFLVPLDAQECSFCEQKECARVSVRVFIPGTNSRGVRNHYDHPQNKAILPVCKEFFDQLQNASYSQLSSSTDEGSTRPFVILATAGFVFQKYYLVTRRCVNYFYHVKRTRLSHRFDFPPEERTQRRRRRGARAQQ